MLHELDRDSMAGERPAGQTAPGAARALARHWILRQTRRREVGTVAPNASAARGVQVITIADRPTVPSTVA
jgi:hypothetical protein